MRCSALSGRGEDGGDDRTESERSTGSTNKPCMRPGMGKMGFTENIVGISLEISTAKIRPQRSD